jgi:hypothetical protein
MKSFGIFYNKKFKLNFCFGWFNGENFKLLEAKFMEIDIDNEFIIFFSIHIGKFIISLSKDF